MANSFTPAVSYVRMSSNPQEPSPEQQRAEVKKLADKGGYRSIREYFDKGISGDDTAKRVAFQQMIRDAEEKGDFAAILCYDQDRFGRFDSIEAGRWIYPLRQAGVWLHTVAQGQIDWNDFTGRVMYSIVQEGKHQFLIDLSRNVLRGKIASARNGRGSNVPPAGYDRQYYDPSGKPVQRVPYGAKFTCPKGWSMRFVLSHDTAMVEVIRWLFDTFANNDCGMGSLAAELNGRGVKSPQGKAWSVPTIKKILTNRVYTGANVFGRNRDGKYHHTDDKGEAARGQGRRKKGCPIVVEGVHDRMIDNATFNRVQEKRAARTLSGSKPRHNAYILSGVLRCGHCGAPMAGKGYAKEGFPRYYICSVGSTRPGACLRYQIPQKAIENYILGYLEHTLLKPASIAAITRAVHRRAKSQKGFKAETVSLRTKIAALDQKITKGTENLLLANPEDMADLSALLAQWRNDRAAMQAELEAKATNPTGDTPEAKAAKVTAEIARLQHHLRAAAPTRKREAIKTLLSEIRLWFEPYGKRNKRFVRGELRTHRAFDYLATGNRGR